MRDLYGFGLPAFILGVALVLVGSSTAAPISPIAPSTRPAENDPAPLRIESSSNCDDIVFMYPVDRPLRISYDLTNRSEAAAAVTADLSIVGRDEHIYRAATHKLSLTAHGTTQAVFAIDPKGLPLGAYSAWLTVHGDKGDLPRYRTYIGVISPTTLRKAKPGEFLFGLDTSLSACYEDPRLLRFTQLMGTDIVRAGTALWPDQIKKWDSELEEAAPIYRKYDLKLAYDVWPPDNRIKDIPTYMELATKHLQLAASQFKDLIPYFELGNEPDIGFFDGPIKMYADEYLKFREAVKRSNPNAVVFNGGWAYNLDRINEFYIYVKPEDVDIIAYHGHGDVTAEENAYRRVKAIATAHGFGDKGLVETESGIMALSTPQEDIQARVCVEKFAFAQAMGEPLFHWFRLSLEFEGDYSSSWQRSQPRPSVMAYRATVETLRGYRFKQILQLPDKDAEAYLFEQIDGPGRACVMWVNGHDRRQAYLQIASAVGDAREVMTGDIYGNRQSFHLLDGAIAALPISEEPVWLVWNAHKPFAVAVAPSLIQAPSTAELQINATNSLAISLHNPLQRSVNATLDANAECDARLDLSPAHQDVRLEAGETRRIDLTATVGALAPPFTWPAQWSVFSRVASNVDAANLEKIPDSLPGDHGPVTPSQEVLRDNNIDLARLANYRDNERRIVSIVMANIDCIDDRVVTLGAGADFWMQWFCNGEQVFDDLAAGNGPGYTFLDHTFNVHLKKGTNLLTCRVLAGGHGYTLAIGSPSQLERASGSSNRNVIRLKYAYGDANVVEQTLAVDLQRPIEPIGSLTFDSPRAAWEHVVPSLGLGDRNVVNLHFKDPDASLWWKGYDDLSATAWLRADSEYLYLIIRVNDDKLQTAPDAARLADFDSLEVALSGAGKGDVTAYLVGLVNDATTVLKTHSPSGASSEVLPATNSEVHADVSRDAKATFYKIALSRKVTGPSCFLNFRVHDNDSGTLKQYLEWRPGMSDLSDDANWYRVRFE